MRHPNRRGARCLAVAGMAVGSLGSASCASGPQAGPARGLRVEGSFYVVQWMAERVGGGHVSVSNLTPPGGEPHDLELTPADVVALHDADVVVYLSGFQPAVDDAVADVDGVTTFDARRPARLASHDGRSDPHFWLDPSRLAAVVLALGASLSHADPDHASVYRDNARTLAKDLDALDRDLQAGLASCSRRELVTSHAAFGYLARRYGFEQVGVTGISPEAEPSPSDLAAVADFAVEHRVHTIYVEPSVDPVVADVVADEVDGETAVLDPIEGITERSAGRDYLQVMRSNLATLRRGQGCR